MTRALDEISDDHCRSCEAVISSIRRTYEAGGYFRGSGWTVETLQVQPLQPRARPVISAGVRIAPQDMLRRKGGQVKHFDGGKRAMLFRLQWRNQHWSLLQLDQSS